MVQFLTLGMVRLVIMQWSFAAVGPRLLLKPPIFFDWKVRLKDLIVNGQTMAGHARITFVGCFVAT